MLSSLDALAEKISPGSGKNSPSQQHPPQIIGVGGVDTIMTVVGTTNNTSNMISAAATTIASGPASATIGSSSKTHFSQNIHPYQKLEHTNNNNNREK